MLTLHLYHGRDEPDQNLNGWGFDGPKLKGVEAFVATYMIHFRVIFKDLEAFEAAKKKTGWETWDNRTLLMKFTADLVQTVNEEGKSAYYGDWEIFHDN